MKRIVLVLAVILAICSAAEARDIRVRVFSKYNINYAVVYGSEINEKCILTIKDGFVEAGYSNGKTYRGRLIKLFPGEENSVTVETAGEKRAIPGKLEAYIAPGEAGMVLVSTMDMEQYVPGVLASEMDGGQYMPELAKAFAVTIRTFAYYNCKRHKGYDFCDLTHCQAFKGAPAGKDKWYKPVQAVKGIILTGDCAGQCVYYSACCGGISENAGEFTAGKESACGLSRPDVLDGRELCKGHRYYRWVKYISKKDLESSLAGFVPEKRPEITNVTVARRTNSGRVKQMNFAYMSHGVEKHAVLDVNKFFSAFGKKSGWALVPSKFFDIRREGNTFVLNGRGHGHGVGLCVQGAYELSKMGKDWREILKFYFPGLSTGWAY